MLNERADVLNHIEKLGSDFSEMYCRLFGNPELLTTHPTRFYFSTCSLWALHIGLLYWHDHIMSCLPVTNHKQYIKALHKWFNLIETDSMHLQI